MQKEPNSVSRRAFLGGSAFGLLELAGGIGGTGRNELANGGDDEVEITSVTEVDGGLSTSDIQAELDSVAAETIDGARGVVRVSGQHTVTEPLVLRTGVHLDADLKLADGHNDVAVKSRDFEALTGTDSAFADGTDSPAGVDGVPYNFGFSGRLDGNTANNSYSTTTAHDGIQISGIAFFGKNYDLDATVFDACKTAFYSECGTASALNTWRDAFRSNISISTFDGDGRGILFRGPHDSLMNAQAGLQGGRGFAVESDPALYYGYLDDLYVHSFGSGAPLRIAAAIRASYVHADFEDLEVTDDAQISSVRLTGGANSIIFDGKAVVGQLRAEGDQTGTTHGVDIRKNQVNIGEAVVNNFGGDGIRIDGNWVHIGHIRSFDNGGINLNVAPSGWLTGVDVSFSELVGGGTAAFKYGGGANNWVSGSVYIAPGETGLAESSATPDPTDNFDVTFIGGGNRIGATDEGWKQTTVTGNGWQEEFTVDHNMIEAPRSIVAVPANGVAAGQGLHAPPAEATDSSFELRWNSPLDDGAVARVQYRLLL